MRLNKYLSKTGIGSRRKCDNYIKDRNIKINGKIITDYSYKVSIDDIVQYNNKCLHIETELYYYILNKPRGYVCTSSDDYDRKIIFDLLPNNTRLFSIGRMDYNTTGILFVTNDGDFSQYLSHPKFQIKKKYLSLTNLKLELNDICKIRKGVKIDKHIMKGEFSFIRKNKNNYLWNIELIEGKNREIKKIFNYFNIKVMNLHRYEFAGIQLGNLKEGKFRKISKTELRKIKKSFNEDK